MLTKHIKFIKKNKFVNKSLSKLFVNSPPLLGDLNVDLVCLFNY